MASAPRASARLREALATLADVTVVAPDRNRSGASNSLTLDVPLRVFEAEPDVYFVAGHAHRLRAPGDLRAVRLRARHGGLRHQRRRRTWATTCCIRAPSPPPSRAASWAARRSRFRSAPRPESGRHFETRRAKWRAASWPQLLRKPLERGPDPQRQRAGPCPSSSCAGFRTTRLGYRHRSEPIVPAKDPRGRPVYWVGPAGAQQDAGPGHGLSCRRAKATFR